MLLQGVKLDEFAGEGDEKKNPPKPKTKTGEKRKREGDKEDEEEEEKEKEKRVRRGGVRWQRGETCGECKCHNHRAV